MSKLKKGECKCIYCETVYIYQPVKYFSHEFCHVRCKFAQEKIIKEEEREKRKIKQQIQNEFNPSTCAYCKEKFVQNFHTRKYCGDICREKLYADKKEAAKANRPEKKRPTSQQIGEWIENARVKKNKGPALKQYNAVRG